MKKRYMIGLFFVCAAVVAVVAVVALLWGRHTMDGFSDGNGETGQETPQSDLTDDKEADDYDEAGASQVQSMGMITTADTMCVYENIDQKDGTVSMVEAKLPEKYVGLNRAQLEAALRLDGSIMQLDESGDGFKSQHLELFSPERIKILRIYDTAEQQGGYYILEVDGEVRIYKSDKKTLYFRTGITLQDLPEDVAREIVEGKYMENEVQVYHFLESYSS